MICVHELGETLRETTVGSVWAASENPTTRREKPPVNTDLSWPELDY